MKNKWLPWELRGSDFSKPGWHLQPTAGYELMIEFLRISPSYELARKANMEGLTDEEKRSLPSDFELVLKTYKQFGDIRQILFRQWWLKRGLKIFGNPYSKPKVHQIAHLQAGRDTPAGSLTDQMQVYLDGARRDEGLTEALVVTVPIGIRKRDINRQIAKLLDSHVSDEYQHPSQPKLKLLGKRLRAEVLLKGMFLLWIKAAKPKWENWRLGVASDFSPTYSKALDVNDSKKGARGDEQYDRILMAKITVRALRKFETIAENAARGKFPCQDPVEKSEFDYPNLALRIQAWSKWKKAEKVRLEQAVSRA